MPGQRTNLIFIMADDHAGYALGVEGDRHARTRNLDRLAAQGTRFAQHYCNSPVCTASRQSIFTGLLPHAAGVTTLGAALGEDKPTLAEMLREAGYRTGAFGVMHFNRTFEPGMHGLETGIVDHAVGKEREKRHPAKPLPEGVRVKGSFRPFREPAQVWLNAESLPCPYRDEEMGSAMLVEEAGKFMESSGDEPFAMWISFKEPHSSFDFPLEWAGRYQAAEFDVPEVGPEDREQIPLVFRELTDDQKRGIRASYYTSVSYLDHNIGRVLDRLEKSRRTENTLVVYLPDHGYCLGHHGRFEKHCGYEQALRVPCMMRLPGRIRDGQVVKDLTESVDVLPTILEVLGIERPRYLQGRSLAPYLADGSMAEPRQSVFSEYLPNEEAFIRTSRYKFIYCTGKRKRADGYVTDDPTPGRYVRLFDLETDPGEFHDIAAERAEVVTELKGVMLERFRSTHPEGALEPTGLEMYEALDWYLRPRDIA